jgi:hypothetical protein
MRVSKVCSIPPIPPRISLKKYQEVQKNRGSPYETRGFFVRGRLRTSVERPAVLEPRFSAWLHPPRPHGSKMPKLVLPLTDAKVKNAKPREKTYKLSDGGGQYLEITPVGSKLWRMGYTQANGKKNRPTARRTAWRSASIRTHL